MDWRIAGAMLNSALYLMGCFVAGLLTSHSWAWKIALAAAGVTYLSYIAQIAGKQRAGNLMVALSVTLGLAAGLALFV